VKLRNHVEANYVFPLDLTSGTASLNEPQKASQEKAQACFVTREANWLVMTSGLLALLNFFIILYGVLLFGQSSTVWFLLVFFGSLAFLMLVVHPAATKIKVTKDGIDWKTLGIGTFIHYGDLKEIRVRRFSLKLDVGKWRTMCPVNRDGFLMAIRKTKPDLQITGWKHQRLER
jgi:hypothetical protein